MRERSGGMEFLLIVGLAVATAVLWRRVGRLEQRIAELSHPVILSASDSGAEEVASPKAEAAASGEPAVEPPARFENAAPEQELAVPPKPGFLRFDVEDLFGRLLPIWAGGITLAVAGFFLVRWSIDAGLLTPPVRVALAGLFGIALLVGAEIAYRWRERIADPRVAQALAGAGLATLYAAFYLAGTGYGLIGSTLAFVGLASVTAAAIALSFRFGLPSAVLGLVGGFAAPALVGSEQANVPLLTLYLALVTAGLTYTGSRQGRAWLGIAALAGGLGWGAILLAGGAGQAPDGLALGAYLVLAGGIIPAFAGGSGRPHWLMRVGAAGLAALQLAALVQQGGFGGLQWGLYLLLGAALAGFGWRDAAIREAGAVAAAVGVALLAFWPDPGAVAFAFVVAGLMAVFSAVPLAQIARGHGRPLDVAQPGAMALGAAVAALAHFGSILPDRPEPPMAAALLALAAFPAAAAGLTARESGAWTLGAQAVAALLAFGALAQVLPEDALAWTGAGLAALAAWRRWTLPGALAAFAALASLWALEPLFEWLANGVMALAGRPMTVAELPGLPAVALRVLPAIVALAAWSLAANADSFLRRGAVAAAAILALVAVHVAYRRLFAALAGDDFVATGVIERALWEAILLGLAWLAWSRGWPKAARLLAAAAFAHFAWFGAVLHNPLWTEQAVGPLPLANALVPAYAVALAALAAFKRWLPAEPRAGRWAIDAATMAAIALLALSELRQAFAGSVLTATPVGPTEDLLRSLTGIVLALGFLAWGSRAGARSWRIGSLAVMVIAVLKVFLVDAAGLEGLARIASFMALGFSLIGLGWFYNRQLRAPRAGDSPV